MAAGDKYVNVLGANIARQCLEAGALDEILVCIAPVMLGDGVRMFDHPGGCHIKLERLTQSEARLATNLWFRRQLGADEAVFVGPDDGLDAIAQA